MSKNNEIVKSENFIWAKTSLIGKGTLFKKIYLGRNQKTGRCVAVKKLSDQWKSLYARDNKSVDLLKDQIQHVNIMKIFSIEPQLNHANSFYLICEYCSELSLYNFISKRSENKRGLSDANFLRLAECLNKGLTELRKFNVSHDDIKPGNILIHKSFDGELIFKLSYLGDSPHIVHNQFRVFKYGDDEEVLTPRPPHNTTIDLFSLGASLYYAATGKVLVSLQSSDLPDQRNILCQMMSSRPDGALSGERGSDGKVTWRDDLPRDCKLSEALKHLVTPILRNLLATRNIWTFEQYDQKMKEIHCLKVLNLFRPVSGDLRPVYLPDSELNTIRTKMRSLWSEENPLIFQHQSLLTHQSVTVGSQSEPIFSCSFTPPATNPPNFSEPSFREIITPGNISDNIEALRYVCELEEGAFDLADLEKSLDVRIDCVERFGDLLLSHMKYEVATNRKQFEEFHISFQMINELSLLIVKQASEYSMDSMTFRSVTEEEKILKDTMEAANQSLNSFNSLYKNVSQTDSYSWSPPILNSDVNHHQMDLTFITEVKENLEGAAYLDEITRVDVNRIVNFYQSLRLTIDQKKHHLSQLCLHFTDWLSKLGKPWQKLQCLIVNFESFKKKQLNNLTKYLDEMAQMHDSVDFSSLKSLCDSSNNEENMKELEGFLDSSFCQELKKMKELTSRLSQSYEQEDESMCCD